MIIAEVACLKCKRSYMPDSEQALCIERHDECIPCRFIPAGPNNAFGSGKGTQIEFDALRIEPPEIAVQMQEYTGAAVVDAALFERGNLCAWNGRNVSDMTREQLIEMIGHLDKVCQGYDGYTHMDERTGH